MKNRMLLIVFCLFTCAVSAQTVNKWDYPRGTEEWRTTANKQEKISLCQIPQKVLNALSTEELTELCLRYPYVSNVLSFKSLNKGLDQLSEEFNGTEELFKRQDASKELLKHYQRNLQRLTKAKRLLIREDILTSISVLEVLLARYHLLNVDSGEKYREILQQLVAGYETKNMYADDLRNKNVGLRTNYYSRAILISKISDESIEELPDKEKNAALISGYADDQSRSMIDKMSYKLLK